MDLEQEIQTIKDRNARVEAEKAWETSGFRIGSIAIVTYFIAAIVLRLIGATNFLLGAFVPAIGYVLSTQSLPALRKWWIKKYIGK